MKEFIIQAYDIVANPGYSHYDIDPYGEEDWGDEKPFYEQNLLPVAKKIASQTIGLDLVSVKPLSSPRIDLGFIDFKYDGYQHKEEKEYKRVYSEIDPYGEEDWDN